MGQATVAHVAQGKTVEGYHERAQIPYPDIYGLVLAYDTKVWGLDTPGLLHQLPGGSPTIILIHRFAPFPGDAVG